VTRPICEVDRGDRVRKHEHLYPEFGRLHRASEEELEELRRELDQRYFWKRVVPDPTPNFVATQRGAPCK